MKIKYMQGDMFTHVFPEKQIWRAFAHGCNAQGVMGSGVAAQIKKLFPWAYREYREAWASGGARLGVNVYAASGDTAVVNLVTQQYYGRDKNVVYVSYEAIEKCFTQLNEECAIVKEYDRAPIEIVMPKIGAGLANGDWNIIESIIEKTSTHYQPVVYTL